MQPKCRYPDPDEFPTECPHNYIEDEVSKCRRDGLPCEVFSEDNGQAEETSEGSGEPEV